MRRSVGRRMERGWWMEKGGRDWGDSNEKISLSVIVNWYWKKK